MFDQSILFVGDGSEDGHQVPPGSLCMVSHKDEEVMNALDGAGTPATEAQVQQEVTAMSKTNIFRPGINVTQAVLISQTTWRRQEQMEMVGSWKAKDYDMHNVVVSIKSKRVPGTMTDAELFNCKNETDNEFDDILIEEERTQLEVALKMESSSTSNENDDASIAHRRSCHDQRDVAIESINGCKNGETKQKKKEWFNGWRRRETKPDNDRKIVPPRGSLRLEEKVAIPVVPTIRVMVTFTKLEELQPVDEFFAPSSSPSAVTKETPIAIQPSSSSWFHWIKSPYHRSSSSAASSSSRIENLQDPFTIPSEYSRITSEAKQKKMQEKNKSKKTKGQK